MRNEMHTDHGCSADRLEPSRTRTYRIPASRAEDFEKALRVAVPFGSSSRVVNHGIRLRPHCLQGGFNLSRVFFTDRSILRTKIVDYLITPTTHAGSHDVPIASYVSNGIAGRRRRIVGGSRRVVADANIRGRRRTLAQPNPAKGNLSALGQQRTIMSLLWPSIQNIATSICPTTLCRMRAQTPRNQDRQVQCLRRGRADSLPRRVHVPSCRSPAIRDRPDLTWSEAQFNTCRKHGAWMGPPLHPVPISRLLRKAQARARS